MTGTSTNDIPEIEPFDPPEYIPLQIKLDIVGNKFTDVWNADRFCDRFSGMVRYCYTRERYYIWNGLLWEPDKTGKIRQLCEMQISDMIDDKESKNNHELLKHLVKSHTPAGIRGMMFFLEANRLNVRDEDLDADKTRINVLNGVINLETAQYESPSRDRFITKRTNVNYTPGASCPLWLDHLDLVFDKDQATIDSFQMIAAYGVLLTTNPEQLFFIPFGTGENGKTVTFNVLAFIGGEYAKSADYRTFMYRRTEKDGSSHSSDIVRLFGANLIIAEEGSEGGRLNEALLKQITGHGKVTSRGAYEKEEISDFLEGKVFFLTNHKPIITDNTHAMLRRIIEIPFSIQIPPHKRDDRIEERLKSEAPGIFNWLVMGLRAWHDNGRKIKLSKKITDATNEFRDAIDEFREFFTDDIEITGRIDDTISKKDLHQYAIQWYNDKFGEYPAIKLKEFNKLCGDHGIKNHKRVSTGWIWIGVKHISPLEREAHAKKREELKRKDLAELIAQMVKDGKEVPEFEEIMENNAKMNFNEPDLYSYPLEIKLQKRAGMVHCGSFLHNKGVNGFECTSSCGESERSKCISDPSKCGRGIRIITGGSGNGETEIF